MSFNGSLAAWLQSRSGSLSLQEVARIVHRMASVLQQLHNQQKIHQDINPSNVLIFVDEATDRLDLQLADHGTIAHTFTRSGKNFHVNSQFMYIAPEQWNGYAVPATDQYALAIMTYQLLTSMHPFQGSPAQLMDLQINVQPAAPSTLNQRVPTAVDGVVLSALAKRPEDRFPSVSAFAHALEQAIQRPASLLISTPELLADGDLRATLLINKTEAEKGTLRTLTLPHGRRITVSVPKDAYDGQIIRLEGFSNVSPMGIPTGVLLLSIAISQIETGPSVSELAEQKTTHPNFISNTSKNAKVPIRGRRTAIANLPLRQKTVLLASLLLIIFLSSIGLFLRLRTSSVPIPYPPLSGSLAIDDTLHDNTGGYKWPDGISDGGGRCQFAQGAYHVVMTQEGALHYCTAGDTGISNYAYEVRMTIVTGDEGGIIFRADGLNGKFYYFRIGRDGSYALYLYIDMIGAHARSLAADRSPAIHTGLNTPNLLAAVVRNDTLDLYVNNQPIISVKNSAYLYGQIGVAATSDTGLTEVVFSNAKVWVL
ncbi:MAG: hypothetical protein PVS3B3_08060 [Ktedonobacteraceae bacterium]